MCCLHHFRSHCKYELVDRNERASISNSCNETHVKCRVFEDNCRCIEIATNHKMGVHTKHLSVWLHHFHVVKKTITITRSNMKQQLAYIFTKPLAKVPCIIGSSSIYRGELSFQQPVHFCICWRDSASYLSQQWAACVHVPN